MPGDLNYVGWDVTLTRIGWLGWCKTHVIKWRAHFHLL